MFVGHEIGAEPALPQSRRRHLRGRHGPRRRGSDGLHCKGATWGDYDKRRLSRPLRRPTSTGTTALYHNNGDGTFTDVAGKLGVQKPIASFPSWFFDYDNDGWLDIFATSYVRSLVMSCAVISASRTTHESCRLYRNLEGKGFQDVTVEAGLDLTMVPMGSNFVDVDNDGFLDFYLGTGDPTYTMLVPNRMFKNVHGKRFADITTSSRAPAICKKVTPLPAATGTGTATWICSCSWAGRCRAIATATCSSRIPDTITTGLR